MLDFTRCIDCIFTLHNKVKLPSCSLLNTCHFSTTAQPTPKRREKKPKMKMLKNCWQSAWEPIKIVCGAFSFVIGVRYLVLLLLWLLPLFSHVQKKPWLTDSQTYIWLHVAGEWEILYLKKIDLRLKLKRNWLIRNALNMNKVDRIRLCCQL